MLDKTKLYMVINYGRSPVGIASRTGSMVIPGSDGETPSSQPFSLDEIIEINSLCGVFKLGLLRFEEKYEDEIYELLRIHNWRDILTDKQIEDILLHPTMESLQRILDIKDQLYFDRVRGVYIGLKSIAADVPGRVDLLIKERTREFAKKIITSEIKLKPNDVNKTADVEALKEQIAALQAQVAAITSVTSGYITEVALEEPVAAETTFAVSEEPAPKKTTKRTTKKK